MQKSAIEQQAGAAFHGLQGGDLVSTKAMPLWLIFQHYLQERGILPERIEDIPESSFAAFVESCENSAMDDARLHLMLSAIRMILSRCGWKPKALAELTAPRVRVRIENSATGAYRYALVRKKAR